MERITVVLWENTVPKHIRKRIYEADFDIFIFSLLILDFRCSEIYGQVADWSTDWLTDRGHVACFGFLDILFGLLVDVA